ncbi:MAG TPA: class I SAM-dependent methyltransferase, partial [Bryobacteraceae bacterium]|nr:class I SAM-dependent methyltransferase [Bryobacteraceae bacterium]
SCPICGGGDWLPAVSAAAIGTEASNRDRFIRTRLRRKASGAELKDLTDFMHDTSADLVRCTGCGVMLRDEPEVRSAASYEEDPNDPDLMQHVYGRYVQAFRNKEAAFRDRLPPGASVLEIGSHLGSFLQVGEEWNWRPVGIDPGYDTSAFAREQGLTVVRETIDDARVRSGSADAVFIWNCFEQLTDPARALRRSREFLRPGGLLILRVPNVDFYLRHRMEKPLWLAWNNLLGFPYLFGYDSRTLNRLAENFGFLPVAGFNSELVTMPFADPSWAVTAEQKSNSEEVGRWSSCTALRDGTLHGPWIEGVYRKREETERRRVQPSPLFLPRAA